MRGHIQPPPRSVEKRQYYKRFRVEPVPGANVLRQGKVTVSFRQIIEVEIERRKTIIARKEQLRLARFARQFERFVIESGSHFGLPLALVDLPQHDQRHRQMLALIERPIDLHGLLGCRNALGLAAVRKRAASDGQIGEEACLETQIADTP